RRAAARNARELAAGGVRRVSLRGHDEVVAVETADLVGPPADGDAAPLGQQRWVVTFVLGERADSVRERERLREIVEREDPAQPLDAVDLEEFPVRDLRQELGDLRVGHRRRVAPAGDAFLRGQRRHAGGAVEPRTASCGRNEKSGSGLRGSSTRLFKALTAVSAISSIGCSTVVRAGFVQRVASIPSKPTTESSSGTRTPCAAASCRTPTAIRSLEQITPVGRCARPNNSRSASRPPSTVNSPCATSPSASRPAPRNALSRPIAFCSVGR